jgi:hypothetical protein
MNEIKLTDFQKELEFIINKYSLESLSNTPDFILAEFLRGCLTAFNKAMFDRDTYNTGNFERSNKG